MSADMSRAFRIDPDSIAGNRWPHIQHVHFEIFENGKKLKVVPLRWVGEGDVSHVGDGDGAGGVEDSVAFESAVAEDVPVFYAADGVFDPRAYSFVDGVEVALPWGYGAAVGFAVGDDHVWVSGVAAVGDDGGVAGGVVYSGLGERFRVVAAAGEGTGHGDGQAGVGVDHHLDVAAASVVLRRVGATVVGGDQGPVDNEHSAGRRGGSSVFQAQQRFQRIHDPTGR